MDSHTASPGNKEAAYYVTCHFRKVVRLSWALEHDSKHTHGKCCMDGPSHRLAAADGASLLRDLLPPSATGKTTTINDLLKYYHTQRNVRFPRVGGLTGLLEENNGWDSHELQEPAGATQVAYKVSPLVCAGRYIPGIEGLGGSARSGELCCHVVPPFFSNECSTGNIPVRMISYGGWGNNIMEGSPA